MILKLLQIISLFANRIFVLSRGDNNYIYMFRRLTDAEFYLRGIVWQLRNYYASDCEGAYPFDLEDDCIWLISRCKITACPGWHWSHVEHNDLEIDGESLMATIAEIVTSY